jgi:hypothetical protein
LAMIFASICGFRHPWRVILHKRAGLLDVVFANTIEIWGEMPQKVGRKAKALLADFKQQLPNTWATLPRSIRRSAGGPANYLATTSPQLIDCPQLARSLFWSLIIAGEVPDKAFEFIKRKTQIICNVILSRAFGPELRKYFAPDNGRFTLNADRLRRSISAVDLLSLPIRGVSGV